MKTFNTCLEEPRISGSEPAFGSGSHLGSSRPSGLAANESILLVEDDKAIRQLAHRILTKAGFDVLEADSAEQAIEVWADHANRINLMLTDVCIPYRATGVELARRFSADKPGLKVIYTSGFSPEMASDDTLLAGNVNFLAKPYNPASLVQIVRNCLHSIAG